MILREFDLSLADCVSVSWWNDINDSRYVAWWKKRKKFNSEIRSTMSLVEKYMSKFNTGDIWKILVECSESPNDKNFSTLLGVLRPQVYFNYDLFSSLYKHQKKETALELLKEGVEIVVQKMDWDITPFNDAFKKVIENDYINEWTWEKKISNEKYTAEIQVLHDVEDVTFFSIFRDKKTREILSKQVLLKDIPNEFSFMYKLGDLKWVSENEIELICILENQNWRAEYIE